MLRERIALIDDADEKIKALRDQATASLAQGALDEVDDLLAHAEELQQQEHTLKQIERQSEIRITRGDAQLFRENPDAAYECYVSAAKFYEPFDPYLAVDTLDRLAGRVYEISRRALTPRFGLASRLLDVMAEMPVVRDNPELKGVADYRRSLIHRNEAVSRFRVQVDRDRLCQAMDYARAATLAPMSADFLDIAVSAKISLANCLMELATIDRDPKPLLEAQNQLKAARVTAKEEIPGLEPHVLNSLGATIMTRARLDGAEARPALIGEALIVFQEAVLASERESNLEIWGPARMNCARILTEQSRYPDTPRRERHFLRVRAIAEYGAAIESFPATLFPDRFAEAQVELASVLTLHGMDETGQLADFYLSRATDTYASSTPVFTREDYPHRWAEIHMHVAGIFIERADLTDEEKLQQQFLEQARICLKCAAETFEAVGDKAFAQTCSETLHNIRTVE